MNNSIEIDEKIFQDSVKFYSTIFSLPQLAAKIYSYLSFDFNKIGVPFDEFVEVFSASKSSVSTNLTLLQNLHLILDANKIDERKRYFYINENYKKIRFEKIVQKIQEELELLNALKNFRKTYNEEYEQKTDAYVDLLQKNITNIQESLNKL